MYSSKHSASCLPSNVLSLKLNQEDIAMVGFDLCEGDTKIIVVFALSSIEIYKDLYSILSGPLIENYANLLANDQCSERLTIGDTSSRLVISFWFDLHDNVDFFVWELKTRVLYIHRYDRYYCLHLVILFLTFRCQFSFLGGHCFAPSCS